MGSIDVCLTTQAMDLSPNGTVTDEQLTRQSTQYLGVIRVTQAFIPYFRRKEAACLLPLLLWVGYLPSVIFVYHATKWLWKAGAKAWLLS